MNKYLAIVAAVVVVVAGGWWWYTSQYGVVVESNPISIQTTETESTGTNSDTADSAPNAPTNSITRESFAGYYAHSDNPEEGYIIVSQSGNTLTIKGHTEETSITGVKHFGLLDTTAIVDSSGKAMVDLSPNKNGACMMTLQFSVTDQTASVNISQTTSGLMCGFGQNVQYSGTYYKKSSVPTNLPVIM